jgi:hypothetical protein
MSAPPRNEALTDPSAPPVSVNWQSNGFERERPRSESPGPFYLLINVSRCPEVRAKFAPSIVFLQPVQDLLPALPLDGPIVIFNGDYVTDGSTEVVFPHGLYKIFYVMLLLCPLMIQVQIIAGSSILGCIEALRVSDGVGRRYDRPLPQRSYRRRWPVRSG